MKEKNDFQAESKKTGTEFERLVKNDLLTRGYKILSCNTEIDEIGINVDYLAQKNELLEHGEAKGGKTGPKKRPGAKRTDNVKKAICNGALLKFKDKNAVYVVYFSEKPKNNSASDKMIRTALEANFIDEVRYLKY